tara:strand:+ start:340 stop:705 length:366 start_codon:yes stop_codon:yes gene_type:complete
MKHIVEGPFVDRKGDAIVIPASEPLTVTTGWLLRLLLDQYQPSQTLTLTLPELRKYSKLWDVLEADVSSCGCYVFEDDDFAVLKKTVLNVVPTILLPQILRHAPELEDLLTAAPNNHEDNK